MYIPCKVTYIPCIFHVHSCMHSGIFILTNIFQSIFLTYSKEYMYMQTYISCIYSMYILVHSRSGARMYLKCYLKYTSKYTTFPGHEGMYVEYTFLTCTQYTFKYTLSRTSQECMLNILNLLLHNILLNIPYSRDVTANNVC